MSIFGLNQFESKPTREIRVVGEDFYSESDLIGNALTGAVVTQEQFKVFNPVVGSIPVDVVNSLPFTKLTSDMLLHDIPMFENVSGRGSVYPSNGDTHIPVSSQDRNGNAIFVGNLHLYSSPHTFTYRTTKKLFGVYVAVGSYEYGNVFSALIARSLPIFRFKSSAFSAAINRAVDRVFAMQFTVTSQFSWIAAKRFATLFALESDRCDSRVRSPMHFFMSPIAVFAAKFSSFSGKPISSCKSFVALLANNVRRHGLLRLIGTNYQYRAPHALATEIFEGVA